METIDFEEILRKAMSEMGQVNILIAGKTGVGKSTLLNSVFGEDLAETGIGRPVTQITREYTKDGSLLHLFDTKGFEMQDYQAIRNDVLNLVNVRKTANPSDHIHVMWYCINASGHRIESSEEQFVKEMSRELPVIVVLTQCMNRDAMTFTDEVRSVFFNTDVQVLDLLARPVRIDEEYTKKAYNVDRLVDITYGLLSEAAQKAFASAQKVNREIQKKAVEKTIAAAAVAAAGVGAVPIPFSDAVALAPIQIGMLAGISHIMGMTLTSSFLSTMVASAAGVAGASYAGRAIVSGILKFIPGIGSVVGGAISAGTASTLTIAMGWAYYKALDKLISSGVELTATAISSEFVTMMKKG